MTMPTVEEVVNSRDADALACWAGDPSSAVRRAVSENPAVGPDLLERLATDPHSGVRTGVASNPNTPHAILSVFAAESNEWIRAAVAGNVATPAQQLRARSGNRAEVERVLSRLTSFDRQDLLSTMDEGLSSQAPWWREWCRDGKRILEGDMTWIGTEPPATVSVSAGAWFCGNCGSSRQPEHQFCGNCGARF